MSDSNARQADIEEYIYKKAGKNSGPIEYLKHT